MLTCCQRLGQINMTQRTYHNSCKQCNDNPYHSYDGSRGDIFWFFYSHETNQNMWLTKIPKTPCQRRCNQQPCTAAIPIREELPVGRIHLCKAGAKPTGREYNSTRYKYQSDKHQYTLNGVSSTYSQETAQECVGNDNQTDYQ